MYQHWEALRVTHLGGLLPRVDGSGFLAPAVALLSLDPSDIAESSGRDTLCSVLIMRFGDDMAALTGSQDRGSRYPTALPKKKARWEASASSGSHAEAVNAN